jgi:uracil-DNA glycosylase
MAAVLDESLSDLLGRIRDCQICVNDPRGRPLPHSPRPVLRVSPSARIAVCGQAPGLRVHESGVPFSDASGVRLRDWMGVTPEEFYDDTKIAIVPMGFCFPGYDKSGSDLPPRRECAAQWRADVMAQLPRIELVLAIGAYAIGWHLPDFKRSSVTQVMSAWHEIFWRPGAHPAILPLPHPSWRNTGWLKSNAWFETDVVPVLRDRVRALMQ